MKASILLIPMLFLALPACVGVRSTGAPLPQSSEEFGKESLHVEVSHSCSGGRCKSFDATFTNLTSEPLEIQISASRMSRSGVSVGLAVKDNLTTSVVVVPPKENISLTLVPVNEKRKPLTYARHSAVYCSLKVDSACTHPKRIQEGEDMCSSFARYYHRMHTSTGGWLTLSFVAKGKSWLRPESFVSPEPQFAGTLPSVTLSEMGDAPSWMSGTGDVVLHKVECDDKCRCRDAVKQWNFMVNDRFELADD